MAKVRNIIGRVFSDLTVISGGERRNRQNAWKCLCKCGNYHIVQTSCLMDKSVQSCGCRRVSAQYKHGGKGTQMYYTWNGIRNRCYNPKSVSYRLYGGAGVIMCDRWRNDFKAFLDDMGLPPSDRHSVDRINGAKIYSKETCKWSTQTEQVRNRSMTVRLTYKGETKPMAEWCEILGMGYGTLKSRVFNYGWSIDEAFETPIRKRK